EKIKSCGWSLIRRDAMRPIISLLTDFGLRDPYVAQIKAVILSYCRDAIIIDLTHEVDAFNELQAAFILRVSVPHMPRGTIHVCVVDPGVGSGRRGIVLETKRGDLFVGPDTGFMVPAAELLGIKHAYLIDESKLPSRSSETFHGRDVFAHVAGKLASGINIKDIGVRVDNYAKMSLPKPIMGANWIDATIMHIDRFGNLITNLRPEPLSNRMKSDKVVIEFKDETIECKFVKAYGFVKAGEPLLTIGGSGFVELAINRGSAAKTFRLKVGDIIRIKPT
ncbi:MAG: hypothetical protein DRN49_00405, partial [Thaumarchaeota archaeon]